MVLVAGNHLVWSDLVLYSSLVAVAGGLQRTGLAALSTGLAGPPPTVRRLRLRENKFYCGVPE